MFLKAITYLGFTALPFLLEYLFKKRYKQLTETIGNQKNDYYYHCLFFSADNFDCGDHIFAKIECGPSCSYVKFSRLISFINSAQKSISICCYSFTLKQIFWALKNAKKRGIEIRIITDYAMSRVKVSKSTKLANYYDVPVRTNMPFNETLMHHKFCLIDNAKIAFGSLNWTLQAFVRNFEFVVLTNDQFIVRKYSEEFESLWLDLNDR